MTFEAPDDPGVFVEIHDDGNVAYAYFHRDGEITGATWLYNRPDGVKNPWDGPIVRGSTPTNVEGYFNDDGFRPIESEDEVEIRWGAYDGVLNVFVYVRGTLLGIVADELNPYPGWSRLATRDSPVARVISPDPRS